MLDSRTFVIGDIHGALRAIQQLMEKINLRPQDKLIFLGDYVDGWSESAQVITFLLELDEKYNCIFIKGNHDVLCEAWLNNSLQDKTWLFNGGSSTITSYHGLTPQEKEKHLAFFNQMRNYYVDDQNRLFIHAGFTSMHGPDKEQYESVYSKDRTLWEMALTMDKRIKKDSKLFPKRLLLFNEIYIGHTPTLNYDIAVPMQACNVWNLDTGAAYYGKLSAMNIDTKVILQSEAVPSLYPGEKAR